MSERRWLTPGPSKLYEPCVECKKKRTICIRVRRPAGGTTDFGHAALSVNEPLSNGTTKTTTYGNWPALGTQNRLQKNYSGDDPAKDNRWRPEDVKCREINEEEEKKLQKAIDKHQSWDPYSNNCAKWAGETWNSTTGDALNYGAKDWSHNSPSTLLDSMNGK